MQEDEDEVELIIDDAFPVEMAQSPVQTKVLRITQLDLMFLFTWQGFFRVSDVGMNVALTFIATFLTLLISAFGLNPLKEFVSQLPRTVNTARGYLGNNSDSFTKYFSCPKYHSVYVLGSCKIVQPDKSVISRRCCYIKFPNHPHQAHRQPCGTLLMKKLRTSAGTTTLYPRQMFCYNSVINSLRNMLLRPGFIEKCEAWRLCKDHIQEGVLGDVYDGNVWKEFLNPNGMPFLSVPFNFALTLNIDWFQPFKHTNHSTGAMYLSIQNLPRHERYASENVLLVGIVPGPHEPSKTMNDYLTPLVEELIELWQGVIMQSFSKTNVLVRAALLCTAYDIPAARKVSSFVGHSALHGCSKCLKTFPTSCFGDKPDYTGFDRTLWEMRSKESHHQHAQAHKHCKTAQQQKCIEREYGCRYSVLLELPYYDVIRMCVIDPMHNLLLGTAKHMVSVWRSCGIILDKDLESIQHAVDSFTTPSDIGRIPTRISSGFSGFTADQWRNWTLLYSLCSLKRLLPQRDYVCWQKFVKSFAAGLYPYNR